MITTRTAFILAACVFLATLAMFGVNAETVGPVQNKGGSCAALLPKELAAKLAADYMGWKVLERSDLIADDQNIWEQQWGNEHCPGVAVGDFRKSGKSDYAIAIVRKTKSLREEKLLFAGTNAKSYRLSELYAEKIVSNFAIVRKGPPGQYKDFYDRTKPIAIQIDTIIYEHIEASAIAFYFKGGVFNKLLVSD